MFKELVQPQQIQNCRLFQLIGSVIGFVRHPYDDGQEIARWDKVINTAVLLLIKIVLSLVIAGVVGAFYEVQNQSDQSLAARFSPFYHSTKVFGSCVENVRIHGSYQTNFALIRIQLTDEPLIKGINNDPAQNHTPALEPV